MTIMADRRRAVDLVSAAIPAPRAPLRRAAPHIAFLAGGHLVALLTVGPLGMPVVCIVHIAASAIHASIKRPATGPAIDAYGREIR